MKIDYRNYFYYDESSPSCLMWKIDYKSNRRDEFAGRLDDKGYWRVNLNIPNSCQLVHRIILMMENPDLGEFLVDHIDRNSSNNKRSNLRICSQADNMRNKRKYKCNISGVSGVYLDNNTRGNRYWVIQWVDASGVRKRKKIKIPSEEEYESTKQLALAERIRLQSEVLLPLGYTEGHGN